MHKTDSINKISKRTANLLANLVYQKILVCLICTWLLLHIYNIWIYAFVCYFCLLFLFLFFCARAVCTLFSRSAQQFPAEKRTYSTVVTSSDCAQISCVQQHRWWRRSQGRNFTHGSGSSRTWPRKRRFTADTVGSPNIKRLFSLCFLFFFYETSAWQMLDMTDECVSLLLSGWWSVSSSARLWNTPKVFFFFFYFVSFRFYSEMENNWRQGAGVN